MSKPLTMHFDNDGNLTLAAWRGVRTEIAKDFQDRLEFLKLDSGLGVARVHFQSTLTGRKYSMFIDDFNELILAKKFIDNQVEGTFRFIKRGQSQAIKLILEKPVAS